MLVLLITQATTHVGGQISSLKFCTSLLGVIQKAMLSCFPHHWSVVLHCFGEKLT